MTNIPDHLQSLFSTSLLYKDGRYYIEVPTSEVSMSPALGPHEQCQVALFSSNRTGRSDSSNSTDPVESYNGSSGSGYQTSGSKQPAENLEPMSVGAPQSYTNGRWSDGDRSNGSTASNGTFRSDPPVSKNDVLSVEIESVGSKGDGVAKVDTGYVLMVPDTEVGDEVTVEVEVVRDNYSFARVI